MLPHEPRLSQEIFDILYKSDAGVAICDGEGRFVWANPQYQHISGFEIHKSEGVHILELMTSHGVKVRGQENMLSVILETGASLTALVDFKTGHDVIATCTPLFNDDGTLRWILYSLVDCDQVFQMQQKLAEMTERMELGQIQLHDAMMEKGKTPDGTVVHDRKMMDIYSSALRMAQVSATVLILGGTGTGKDHLAKFIHSTGDRCKGNFVHVNCSAIPENLFEAELFGYEAGAFTGASRKGKMGLIEFADHGTLYLDEVAELPLTMQTKLLSVLQNRQITRIGGVRARPVDVRIIAATNRDLQRMIEEKTFREDFYYRINVLEIRIPDLRDRVDDIIPLVLHFTELFNARYQMHKRFSHQALRLFNMYSWPGNVRELAHIVERLIIMSSEDFIGVDQLPEELRHLDAKMTAEKTNKSLREVLEHVEEQFIREVISASPSLKDAAKSLGIELSTLTRKKQKYNIYLKGSYAGGEARDAQRS